MKASIKVLDLDGSGDEIAKALGVTFGIVSTPDAYPITPADPNVIEVSAGIPVATRPVETGQQAPVPSRRVEAEIPASSGGEVLEGGPFEFAEDIPAAWRWVNDTGMTCHIRTQPGIAMAMCPQGRKKIGTRRMHDTEIPFKSTEVCEGCNKALVKSRRNDQ
jgi:hypothetical protein